MALTLRFLSTGSHKRQLKWAAKGDECWKSKGVGGHRRPVSVLSSLHRHDGRCWLSRLAQRGEGPLSSPEPPPDGKTLRKEEKAAVSRLWSHSHWVKYSHLWRASPPVNSLSFPRALTHLSILVKRGHFYRRYRPTALWENESKGMRWWPTRSFVFLGPPWRSYCLNSVKTKQSRGKQVGAPWRVGKTGRRRIQA